MKKIRMGVIGVGGISALHIGGTLRSKDAELVAICDNHPETLAYKGDLYGIPEDHRFLDYNDLITCPDVDAISNCTPNHVHFEVMMAVLKAKKPLMTEKPMTMTEDEAAQALAAAKEAGVANMLGFTYRFYPAMRYARHIVRSGELGEIRHVYGQYKQAGSSRKEAPRVWRFNKALTGTGALGDLGSHSLDMARFVVGGEFVSVSAELGTYVKQRISMDDYRIYYTDEGRRMERIGDEIHWEDVDVDDYSHMHLMMDNGVSTAFEITRCGYGRGNYQRLEIQGSEGALIYENDGDDDHTAKLYVCIGSTMAMSHAYRRIDIPSQFNIDEMQCFFNMIAGKGDDTLPTIEDGYKNMAVLEACVRSHEEGRRIALKG